MPDLSICAEEPIHIPGSVEPNGALLVLKEPELTIVQVSANVEALLGETAAALLGVSVSNIFEAQTLAAFRQILPENLQERRRYLNDVRLQGTESIFDATIHRHQGLLILELEPIAAGASRLPASDAYTSLTAAMADLDSRLSLVDLCQRVAARTRDLTGFDRVMVYQFLEDGSGSVIAEACRNDLTPYLGLRYPASDIPAQARRLYLLNPLRLKADVYAPPVLLVPTLNPVTGQPLDMTYCVLRAMSPVHVEYLKNMGVSASMSVSIVRDEQLWGLIACHHTQAKTVPSQIRISCDALARVFSAYIAAAERRDRQQHSVRIRVFRDQLEERLRAAPEVCKALIEEGAPIASAINAKGATVCIGDELALIGITPPREDVERLLEWLATHQDTHILLTDKLSDSYPAAERFASVVSGLLSSRIALESRDFVLWFRPPAVKVIEWGGNPNKPVEETEAGRRISPRLSFERWKQTVGDHSEPWQDDEKEYALGLRQTIAEMLLVQKNRKVMQLYGELEKSNVELDAFAYVAGHDLQEPLRMVTAFSELLRKGYQDVLRGEGLEYLDFVTQGAQQMRELLTDLLLYARAGKEGMSTSFDLVDLNTSLQQAIWNLGTAIKDSGASIVCDPLPSVHGYAAHFVQVFQNLIGNAIKYRGEQALIIHVFAEKVNEEWRFAVVDNGIGIDLKDHKTVFGVFKRLHRENVAGSGIGLAICQRVVDHYGGRIWVDSAPDRGATFYFTLPLSMEREPETPASLSRFA